MSQGLLIHPFPLVHVAIPLCVGSLVLSPIGSTFAPGSCSEVRSAGGFPGLGSPRGGLSERNARR